jgi:hypothetical protein
VCIVIVTSDSDDLELAAAAGEHANNVAIITV